MGILFFLIMAKTIKNFNELSTIFDLRISKALEMTRNEMFKIFQKHITDYYHESVFIDHTSALPLLYERTYKLLNSLIKTDVEKSNGIISCSVRISPEYLNYKYMTGTFTGLDVVLSANEQFHGWSVEGDMKIWDDALAELGYKTGILSLAKKNLKKCGVPVK